MQETDTYWVASAAMGYGHQRAVDPFCEYAFGGILNADDTPNMTDVERRTWKRYLQLYESFSRVKSVPLVGNRLFKLLDGLLHIPSRYPIRNLSRSTFQVNALRLQIQRGLGKGFVETLSSSKRPLLTSFYVPAIAADMIGYDQIHTIICDADLNRVWVARDPSKSNINYFAPCGKVAQRLKSYGVPEQRIFLTGFPLDDTLLGGRDLTTLKADLAIRLQILDPTHQFQSVMRTSVEQVLGSAAYTKPPTDRVFTITFAVGGAGAQCDIGISLMKSFKPHLLEGSMRLVLVAGTREDVRTTFEQGRLDVLGDCPFAEIIYADQLHEYFRLFNEVIRRTDILWTKPSELCFYTGLGLPILMAPPIGSQEKFNQRWLLEIGGGLRQDDPEYANEWLIELLEKGRFADMAWLGFLRARKLGTHHILDVLSNGSFEHSDHPLHR